ncbi:unnamed protein product, partial [Eretmochelys imbricata]
ERYNPEEDAWSSCPPLGTYRENFGCATFQGKIYTVSGHDDFTELCSAERFDPVTNEWSPMMPMKSKRNKSCESCRSQWIPTGHRGRGVDGVTHVTTVEACDLDANKWRPFGNTKTSHPDGGVAVLKMTSRS